MNNERTIVIENIGNCSTGLKDTQNRTYRLGVGAKMRISLASLQDILDYPASRTILNMGLVKIGNIDADTLYDMGLNDKEIEKYTCGEATKAIVITKDVEAPIEEAEEVIPVEEPKEEVKPEPKKTTTTKKSTTTKKTSSSKSKK